MGFPLGAKTTIGDIQSEVMGKNLIQAADIIKYVKTAFNIPIRGKATYHKKALGWFSPETTEIRMKDVRGITTAMHEIGHHIDWTLNKRMSANPPSKEIGKELLQLGKDLYGSIKPKGGYKSEGWAEFIREYIINGNIQERAPKLFDYFNNEYLPKNPDIAKSIHKMEDMVAMYRAQGAQGRVRAFRQPLKTDWSPSRIAGRISAWVDDKIRDMHLFMNREMKSAGIDINKVEAEDNPYIKATA